MKPKGIATLTSLTTAVFIKEFTRVKFPIPAPRRKRGLSQENRWFP